MGLAFEAHHLLLDKTVAIKILRPELTGQEELRRRFEIEARAAAAVAHPNVVTVSDMGRTSRGAVYFVMDRLVGETLAERLERMGQLPFGAVVAIAVQILDALEAAHAQGVVHRDLKLENVFLATAPGGHERVKVLDFGVAKVGGALMGSASSTRTGVVMGTPEFMAPEQARGDKDIDARADLCALAVMLYRMVSGRAPFVGETAMAMLAALLTETPPHLGQLCPDLPPAAIDLITAAMSRDREQRPRSAGEFRARLRRACAEPAPERAAVKATSSDLVPLDHRTPPPLREPETAAGPPPVAAPTGTITYAPPVTVGLRPAAVAPLDPADAPLELDTPPPVLVARRRSRGQMAPDEDERQRLWMHAQLRRAATLVGFAVAGWLAWHLARPLWRAVDQRLHPSPAAEPTGAAPAPPPTSVTVQIAVDPVGASVSLDGELLGRNSVDLLRAPGRHTLSATKEGYHPASVEFVADASKTVQLRLSRHPRRRPR